MAIKTLVKYVGAEPKVRDTGTEEICIRGMVKGLPDYESIDFDGASYVFISNKEAQNETPVNFNLTAKDFRGTVVVARAGEKGELASLNDEDIEKLTALLNDIGNKLT